MKKGYTIHRVHIDTECTCVIVENYSLTNEYWETPVPIEAIEGEFRRTCTGVWKIKS